MINILVITSGNGGVPFYRIKTPHTFLQEKYVDKVRVDILEKSDFIDLKQLDGSDILFFHRYLDTPKLKNDLIIKHCNDNNIKVIMDIDDSFELPTTHGAYHQFKQQGLKTKILKNFKLVDMVTTTTPYFRDQIKKYTSKPVEILPNAIDPSWTMFQDRPSLYPDRTVVGWIGGSQHLDDLKPLTKYTQQICKIPNVSFMFGGYDSRSKALKIKKSIQDLIKKGEITKDNIHSLGLKQDDLYETTSLPFDQTVSSKYEKIFTDNFRLCSDEYKDILFKYEFQKQYPEIEKDEKYIRKWTMDINKYADMYNDVDISLAPLYDLEFSRCKSNLKILESGFKKIPIICQNLAPYSEDIVHGENGFLIDQKRNHKDWFKYTKVLINNSELRKKMGENLYKTVSEKYTLDIICKKRLDLYKQIVGK